jgi:hypothetical protein
MPTNFQQGGRGRGPTLRRSLRLAARHELCEAIEVGISSARQRGSQRLTADPPTGGVASLARGELAAVRSSARATVGAARTAQRVAGADQERIWEARRHTGWGHRLLASVVGAPHSTVHRTLAPHGISRPPRKEHEDVVRYEWPCPGAAASMAPSSATVSARSGFSLPAIGRCA